jgi:hypothetical protein
MTQSLKQKVAVLLAEADKDIIQAFFGSDADEDYEDFTEANVKFEYTDNHGGEGEGEDFWSLYKFTDGTDEVFVQFDGYYYSYDGSTFDSWFFVKPQQVTVTQYFKDNTQ